MYICAKLKLRAFKSPTSQSRKSLAVISDRASNMTEIDRKSFILTKKKRKNGEFLQVISLK
jgi:hypothetical protein